jgi:hypothetical protein
MQAKFARHQIHAVRRFPAVNGQTVNLPPGWSSTPGAYGCLLSHLQIVREARARGLPSVLIFEDDVVFDERLQDNFSTYIGQLPSDWEMLHFGALHMDEPTAVSENVQRIRRAYSTYTYALRDTIFDAFIELNTRAMTPVDINNHVLQAEHACYCFTPYLAWVETDSSDVQGRQKNHWYLQESLVIHGSVMDNLLSKTSLVLAYGNPKRDGRIERHLLFLTRFYRERLPGIKVVVVEQGAEPTFAQEALPEGCRYFLLREDGPLDRGRCFNVGMRLSNPDDEYIIFSDSDIFIEEWDIRGNLRMCQRYDGTTGFGSVIELASADTLTLQRNKAMLTPWFNVEKYSPGEKHGAFDAYSVFNRRSIQAAGGWEERRAEETAQRLSLKDERQLHVFRPPNYALRLSLD